VVSTRRNHVPNTQYVLYVTIDRIVRMCGIFC
jgi:hypothetical protein